MNPNYSKVLFADSVYDYLLTYGILPLDNKNNIENLKEKIDKIYLYYEELLEWNKKINLTAVTEIDGFIKRHVIDSAYLFKILNSAVRREYTAGGYILDIGSGAGFPGMIIDILIPDLKIISVESVLKKCNFQKAAARKLGLNNFKCLNINIFNYKDYDQVTAIVTRAAFNAAEIIRLIENLDLKNGTDIYLFLSKTEEVKNIGSFKYKSKKAVLDRTLYYKTDYIDGLKDNFRLIAKFKIIDK